MRPGKVVVGTRNHDAFVLKIQSIRYNSSTTFKKSKCVPSSAEH